MKRRYNIDFKKDLEIFSRTLGFVWESSRGLTIAGLILIVFRSFLPIIPLYLIKLLIDNVAEDVSGGLSDSWWILIMFGVVQLFIIIISNISQYITKIQGDVVSDHMSRVVLKKSIEMDMAHYDSDRYHDTYHRAQFQAGHRPVSLLNSLTQLTQYTFTLLALSGLLATLHWAVGLVMVVMVIPIAWVQLKYTRILFKWRERTTPLERKANYLREMLSTITYAKEVRIFAYGQLILDRFSDIRKKLMLEKKELYKRQNLRMSMVQAIEAVTTIGVLVFIIVRAIGGFITLGDIVMYFQAFQKGQSSIHQFLKSGVSLYDNRLFLQHIFQFLNIEPNVKSPEYPVELDRVLSIVQIENLSFSYPESKKEVLKDVNLELHKGTITAIVGENGSGKTTLVKLLNRLYDPSRGCIKFNGTDIKNFSLPELRKRMSVIYQDFARYDLTVTENIHIADMENEIDMGKIIESTKLTGADGFIHGLEDGYENQLGRSFRGGQELSGGQWQKIALSRAFYKDDEIVILDEPTSFIDPLAEYEIFSNLKRSGNSKIIVLITHRVYNLKMADQIVVMDKGQIVECGSHADLMNLEGTYFKMFSKQS